MILLLISCIHQSTPTDELYTKSTCISGLKEQLVDISQCELLTLSHPDFPGTVLEPINCHTTSSWTQESYLAVSSHLPLINELEAVCIDGTVYIYNL